MNGGDVEEKFGGWRGWRVEGVAWDEKGGSGRGVWVGGKREKELP